MWWLGDGSPAKYKMFAPNTGLHKIETAQANNAVMYEICIFATKIRNILVNRILNGVFLKKNKGEK